MTLYGTVKITENRRQETMSIKAVLFDFDDTLGDRETYTHLTYIRRVDEVLKDADPWFRETVIQICLVVDEHGEAPKSQVRKTVLEKCGVDLGEDLAQFWMDHQWESTVLYGDARPTLEELKKRGYRVGIITNGTAFGQRRKIEKSGILNLMDAIVISGETDTAKPDPKIFELAAEKLGLSCAECAFVGDMFRNDIYGAHLAGMRPIWIWPHGCDRYADVDVEKIDRLSNLLDIFPPLNNQEGQS